MDPKYYDKDFVQTQIEEIEYVRSPLYDLAKNNQFKDSDDVDKHFEEWNLKMDMIDDLQQLSLTPQDTRESVAFKRYADYVHAETKREKEIL